MKAVKLAVIIGLPVVPPNSSREMVEGILNAVYGHFLLPGHAIVNFIWRGVLHNGLARDFLFVVLHCRVSGHGSSSIGFLNPSLFIFNVHSRLDAIYGYLIVQIADDY